MKVILLTQEEPFYLARNLTYLIDNFPKKSSIVACVLFTPSPYGRKKTLFQKALQTYKIFGLSFFAHYAYLYLISRLKSVQNIVNVLRKNSIEIIRLQKDINDIDSISLIASYKPDLLVSILSNEIFKKALLDIAPKGCINLHSSLLPKYRGLMPTFWVLKNQEKETGVSVFYVDEGIDSGEIIVQEKVVIRQDMTQADLIKETKQLGMRAIIKSVELIQNNNIICYKNDEQHATYFSLPKREDVIDFLRTGNKFF